MTATYEAQALLGAHLSTLEMELAHTELDIDRAKRELASTRRGFPTTRAGTRHDFSASHRRGGGRTFAEQTTLTADLRTLVASYRESHGRYALLIAIGAAISVAILLTLGFSARHILVGGITAGTVTVLCLVAAVLQRRLRRTER